VRDDRIQSQLPHLTFWESEDSPQYGVTISSHKLSRIAKSISTHSSTTMTTQDMISEDAASAPTEFGYRELPFPPVTKQHILNCSYHNWHPK
jgi:hypothetical protein